MLSISIYRSSVKIYLFILETYPMQSDVFKQAIYSMLSLFWVEWENSKSSESL